MQPYYILKPIKSEAFKVFYPIDLIVVRGIKKNGIE